MKPKIGIVGSGNIGWALKQMLKEDYEIHQGDITDGFDASNIDHVKVIFNWSRCSNFCWTFFC